MTTFHSLDILRISKLSIVSPTCPLSSSAYMLGNPLRRLWFKLDLHLIQNSQGVLKQTSMGQYSENILLFVKISQNESVNVLYLYHYLRKFLFLATPFFWGVLGVIK